MLEYDYLVFDKDQLYYVGDHESGGERTDVPSLLPYIGNFVDIRPGTTFQNVWDWIEKDYEIIEIIFSEALGNFPLKPFNDQITKPSNSREDEDPEDRLEYLKLSWSVGLEKWKKNQEKYDMVIVVEFCGIGPQKPYTDSYGNKHPSNGAYGIDFTLINDLKNYEIKLDTYFDCMVEDGSKDFKEYIEGKFSCEKDFTLYDIIKGILFEITFHGLPNQQIGALAKLDQSIAGAKEELAKSVPFNEASEDIRKELDEQDNND